MVVVVVVAAQMLLDDFSWVQGARQFPFCELGRNSIRRTAKCASRSMSRSSAQTINALNLDGLRRSSPPSTLARSSAAARAAVTFTEFEPGVPVRQKPSAFCLLLKDKQREGGDLDGYENSKWVAFRRASHRYNGESRLSTASSLEESRPSTPSVMYFCKWE